MSQPIFTQENLTDEMRERLSKIKYVITDADGTMITGAKATIDSEGNPSWALIETLVELKRAGITVIPCSGRNRAMLFEDARILDFDGWIAEMGGLLCTKQSSNPEWSYFTGDMNFDHKSDKTPHDLIWDTGVIDKILTRYEGLVETYHDNNIGYEYREVSIALRGKLPLDEVQTMLDESGLPLYTSDNGFVKRISGETTLACDRNNPKDIHTYHIMPQGLTKGTGIARYIELQGWDKSEVFGAGDSPADLEIAQACEMFLFMKNGMDHPAAQHEINAYDNVFISDKPSTDGWISAMKTILAVQNG